MLQQYYSTSGKKKKKLKNAILILQKNNFYFFADNTTVAHCVDVSQRGLLSVVSKSSIQIWKDVFTNGASEKQQSPYMNHSIAGQEISDVAFCPFEDVLGK